MNCKHGIEIAEDFCVENCVHCKTESRFRWRRMIANLRRKRRVVVVLSESTPITFPKKENSCDTKSG
jgi:hypothetical protein